jgi:hypothetical protein
MFNTFSRFLNSIIKKPDGRLHPESDFRVTMDAVHIVCRDPQGSEARLAWDDLEEVIVETNDTGPWGMDVLWVLRGRDGKALTIPHGASGDKELFEQLHKLPEFSHAQVIEAMACADNRQFLCWQRIQSSA